MEIFLSDTNTYTCGWSYPEIFEYAFVILLDPVFTASIINKHGIQQGCGFFVSCSDLISCVQINVAVINLHNQYIRDQQDVLRLLPMNSGHHKVKKERTITKGKSGRDQEGQAHGGTILSISGYNRIRVDG